MLPSCIVMLVGDVIGRPGRDLAAQRNEVDRRGLVIVIARVAIALRRRLVIVEAHARRDDVDERESVVRAAPP